MSLYRCVLLLLHKEARVADRKECHNGGPTLCIPLYNGASSPWCLGAPPSTSLVEKPLPYHHPTVVLSLGPLPKPPFSPQGSTQLRLKCPGL